MDLPCLVSKTLENYIVKCVYVIPLVTAPDASFNNHGPIPSRPVDFATSNIDKNLKTKGSSMSGNSKCIFSGIFEFICSCRIEKSLCSIGCFSFEAIFPLIQFHLI